jgi:pimeloyl-ACP methyl ester carboxylesterase
MSVRRASAGPLAGLLARLRFAQRRRRRRAQLRAGVTVSADHQPLTFEDSPGSRSLLIAFGGLNRAIGIPPFEFLSLTSDVPVKRLFVRDVHQSWYHRGLPTLGRSIDEVADALRAVVAAHDVDRLVVAGNSAGGYAALLFGTLLGADTVLSFSPQTTIEPEALARMGDGRWDDHLAPLVRDQALDRRWVDLAVALPGARDPSSTTRCLLFFDDTLELDRIHAERLRGLDGTRLYRFGHGGHYLVRTLRDCGALKQILQRALRAAETPGASARPA